VPCEIKSHNIVHRSPVKEVAVLRMINLFKLFFTVHCNLFHVSVAFVTCIQL